MKIKPLIWGTFLGFSCLSLSVQADTWLQMGGPSYHFTQPDEGKHYNQLNYGLGIEQTVNKDWRVAGGWYKNSNFRDSFYLGALYTPWKVSGLSVGAFGGVVSGYLPENRLMPVIVPYVGYEWECFGVGFGALPPVVVGLQIKGNLTCLGLN